MRLNLGCGLHPAEGWVNVDIAALPGVDVICDLDKPWPWPDESADEISASHLFEHVEHPVLFMAEAWRVLVDGGQLDIRVPYYQHPFAYSDPTHKRFCTEITFDYWIPGTPLHEGYGYQMGSVKGGPRFECEAKLMAGAEREEFRIFLHKMPGDG